MDQKDKTKQLLMDFHNAFDNDGGKRVLANLSFECNEESLSFVRNDPYSTAYNEGKRYVILHIRRVLATDPNKERQTEAKD